MKMIDKLAVASHAVDTEVNMRIVYWCRSCGLELKGYLALFLEMGFVVWMWVHFVPRLRLPILLKQWGWVF